MRKATVGPVAFAEALKPSQLFAGDDRGGFVLPTIAHAPDNGTETRGKSATSRLGQLLALRARIDAAISAEIALCERLTGLPPRTTDEAELICVARLLGVRPEQLLARDQRATACRRRHLAAWLLHHRELSLARIGAVLHRDHTTVLHSLRVVENDPAMRAQADELLGQTRAAS